jgi:hypothetical protein
MPNVSLVKWIGVKDVDPSQKDQFGKIQKNQFKNHLVAHLNFNNLKIIPTYVRDLQPVVTSFQSGWIIDGRFPVTDDGLLLGEGFYWSESSIGHVIKRQNEKLKLEADSKNLLIRGFSDDKGVPIDTIREIDNDEVKNTIFFSGFDNLSHFMMEIAPKTLVLPILSERFPNIKTITTGDIVPKRWIEYSIKTAGSVAETYSNYDIKQINSNKAIRFENIVVISSTTYKDRDLNINMSVSQAKFFSELMKERAASNNNQESYILYLSRKNASHRKTVNQENLIELVKKVFPDLKLIIEDNIHLLSMEDQAKLIYNASLIIEEGGGSTGFVSNLLDKNVPYLTMHTAVRSLDAGRLYLAGLSRYAAWVLGEPVGELSKSNVIDNDILVDEKDFESLLVRLSLFVNKKMPMPIL